jgi:acetyl esterase/lipase
MRERAGGISLTSVSLDMIVLPGGGYAQHVAHEAEPVAGWLAALRVPASVFRYPLHARHPVPLEALRADIRRRREAGAQRIGLIGFSAGGHLAGLGPWHRARIPASRSTSSY